jgi:tetratricopeptide (TPR) repeat protein
MNRLLCTCLFVFLTLLTSSAQEVQSSTPAASPAEPKELVEQGRKLNAEGKHDEALALYRQALEKSPDLYEAHLATGITLDLKGQYEEARRHLAKAIEVAPSDSRPRALRTMAMSYAFERKPDDAAKYQQQIFNARLALQDFEGAAEVANELARIYLESGNLDSAHRWYMTGHGTGLRKPNLSAAERDLWIFRWQHAQARIAARRGQRDDAQKYVTAARAILDKGTNPEQTRYYPYLTGYVALYSGDYKTAISELQKADQRDPFILSLLAQAYEKSGDAEQAKEHYRKVLASNAHNPTNAFARPLAKQKLGLQ